MQLPIWDRNGWNVGQSNKDINGTVVRHMFPWKKEENDVE